MINPYTPPSTPIEDERSDCPICGNRVGYYRFLLPLGHCQGCGNYLAVRNWNAPNWPWAAAMVTIFASPMAFASIGYALTPLSIIPVIIVVLILRYLYDKTAGRLVPAFCWGIFALPDDDRIKPN